MAGAVQVALEVVDVHGIHGPVQVEEYPLPLDPGLGGLIVLYVAAVGIAHQYLAQHVVQIVVQVDAVGNVAQVVFVLEAVFAYEGQQLLVIAHGAVERVGVALYQVDVVYRGRIGYALVLGDVILVYALAQVVYAPALAVYVQHAGRGGLIHGVGARRQRGERGVAQVRVGGVLAAGTQRERPVAGEVELLKGIEVQRGVAVLGAGVHGDALLLLRAAVLADYLYADALGGLRCAAFVEVLNVGGILPAHPEVCALTVAAIGLFLKRVGAHYQQAGVPVEQVLVVGYQRHYRQLMVQPVEVALGGHVGGEVPVAEGGGAHHGGGGYRYRPGVERGGGRGRAAVGGVVYGRALGGGKLQRYGLAHQPAAYAHAHIVDPARVADGGIGRSGRGLHVGKAALGSAAVGYVAVLLAHGALVHYRAVGQRQRDRAAGGGEAEAGVVIPVRGLFAGAVAVDDQVLARAQARALGELPLARVAGIVGQAHAAKVHGGAACVVQLDIVAAVGVFGGVDRVGAEHLLYHDAGGVGLSARLERVQGGLGCVGRAGRGHEQLLCAGARGGVGGVRARLAVIEQGDYPALRIGKQRRAAVRGEGKAGMQLARAAVLAAGEHHHVLAGLKRHVGEGPLERAGGAVAQPPAAQIDCGVAAVVHLYPVGGVAVRVQKRGAVAGLHLAYDYGRIHIEHHRGRGVERRVVDAGRDVGRHAPLAALQVAGVGGVGGQRGQLDIVVQLVRVGDEVERFARRGEPERGLHGLPGLAYTGAGGVYQRAFAGLKHDVRQRIELVGGQLVGQHQPGQRLRAVGDVLQLYPVAELAPGRGKRPGVGAGDLAYAYGAAGLEVAYIQLGQRAPALGAEAGKAQRYGDDQYQRYAYHGREQVAPRDKVGAEGVEVLARSRAAQGRGLAG